MKRPRALALLLAACALLGGCARPPAATTAPPAPPATPTAAATASPTAAPSGSPGPSAAVTASGPAAAAPPGAAGGAGLSGGAIAWVGYDADVLAPGGGGSRPGRDGVNEGHIRAGLTVGSTARLTGFALRYSSADFAHNFITGGTALIRLDGQDIPAAGGVDLAAGQHTLDFYLSTLLGGAAPADFARGSISVVISATDGQGRAQEFRGTVTP